VAAGSGIDMYAGPAGAPHVELNPAVLEPVGSSGPHNNMMPYLTFHFCIALQGIYPPRP
jgi:microcystin-dependent protein